MARLKQEPLTEWIGDLPSHAAQMVCKDVVKAIKTMTAERKKPNGRNVGFPRFKRSGTGADNSVYFANTQIAINFGVKYEESRSVKFPAGLGRIKCGVISMPRDGRLMGGRVWRQGDQWWLSAQYEMKVPEALPKTGREIAIKVASSVLVTTLEVTPQGERLEQVKNPPEDKRIVRSLKLLGHKEVRQREKAEAKARKLAARKKWQREKAGLKEAAPLKRSKRIVTKKYRETVAKTAALHAHETNCRNDLLHAISRRIADRFDTVIIEKMDVASLMRNAGKHRRRFEKRKARRAEGKRLGEYKSVRKLNRRAAMGRNLGLIKLKTEEAGKTLIETAISFKSVQMCYECLELHPEMRDGRAVMVCRKCGRVEDRRINAVRNLSEEGSRLLLAREVGNA